MTYHPILIALALTASAAHAQHAATMTMTSDTFTVRTDGPVPVVAVELLAGDGATFAAGTGALALAGLALVTAGVRRAHRD